MTPKDCQPAKPPLPRLPKARRLPTALCIALSSLLLLVAGPRGSLLAASTAALVSSSSGTRVELTWDANQESNLAGYRLYLGYAPGRYIETIELGTATNYSLGLPVPGQTYYFTLTAYSKFGLESAPTPELSVRSNDGTRPLETLPLAISLEEDTAADLWFFGQPLLKVLNWWTALPPEHGAIDWSSGSPRYTPANDYHGTDHLELFAELGNAVFLRVGWNLEISPVNDVPVVFAVPFVTAKSGAAVAITLTGTDADQDNLRYEVMTPPSAGTVTINGRTAIYTSDSQFVGQDVFSYRATDGTDWSEPATVGVTVTAAPPIQVTLTARPDVTLFFSLTWNSLPGRTYQVWSTADLDHPAWLPASPDLVAQRTLQTYVDSIQPDAPQAFYRIVQLP